MQWKILLEKGETTMLMEKCPLCGSKMEIGRVGSSYPISWVDGKGGWRRGLFPEQLFLGSVEARRCRNCKIVFFKYGREAEPIPKSSEELYGKLEKAYVKAHGSPSWLEDRINAYMKEGLSREEAIRRVAEDEGYL